MKELLDTNDPLQARVVKLEALNNEADAELEEMRTNNHHEKKSKLPASWTRTTYSTNQWTHNYYLLKTAQAPEDPELL